MVDQLKMRVVTLDDAPRRDVYSARLDLFRRNALHCEGLDEVCRHGVERREHVLTLLLCDLLNWQRHAELRERRISQRTHQSISG
jgi:hypothetical protein